MKIYEGFVPKGAELRQDARPRLVYVRENGESRRLLHHVLHSPTGFNWGYLGSGPAELARCLLWDFLGYEPHTQLYQKFKEDYVAQWGNDDWVLSAEAIRGWLTVNPHLPLRAGCLYDESPSGGAA